MPLEITLTLFNSLIVYYIIGLKQAVSCNNNTTLLGVCVEIPSSVSINYFLLKLLSNKPSYVDLSGVKVLNCTTEGASEGRFQPNC